MEKYPDEPLPVDYVAYPVLFIPNAKIKKKS